MARAGPAQHRRRRPLMRRATKGCVRERSRCRRVRFLVRSKTGVVKAASCVSRPRVNPRRRSSVRATPPTVVPPYWARCRVRPTLIAPVQAVCRAAIPRRRFSASNMDSVRVPARPRAVATQTKIATGAVIALRLRASTAMRVVRTRYAHPSDHGLSSLATVTRTTTVVRPRRAGVMAISARLGSLAIRARAETCTDAPRCRAMPVASARSTSAATLRARRTTTA